MEDTNKKKKNKKKKNKNANRPTENVAPNEKEFITGTQSNTSEALQDSGSEVSLNTDADREGHLSNGTATNLNKNEGKYYLDREASFQEKIKQLHSEKDALEQREALLEDRINELLNKINDYSRNEVSQKQIIQRLQDEKYESVRNEASLRGIIMQLNKEKDALMQKENSAKESITSLNDQNTRLQNQVIELEKSRDSLTEENQHLMGIISSLELQIELLKGSADTQISSKMEKEGVVGFTSKDGIRHGDVNHHIDIEAAKPVEQKSIPETPEIDSAASRIETMQMMMGLSGSSQSLEDVMLEDERDDGSKPHSSTGIVHSEIEEIGGGEGNHSKSKESSSSRHDKDDITVPLSDAPLIGAPFRLISFVARYVSGADLVDKSSWRRG